MHCDQRKRFRGRLGLPSRQALSDIFLHRPTSDGSMFPTLTEVTWTASDAGALAQLLLFLVPSVTVLRISCKGPLEDACVKALSVLGPRNPSNRPPNHTPNAHANILGETAGGPRQPKTVDPDAAPLLLRLSASRR